MQEQALETNRITQDQVKAAYELTGLRPVQSEWIVLSLYGGCACGLSAVYASKFDAESLVRTADEYISGAICRGLELDYHYVNGFTCGFDGDPDFNLDRASVRFKRGYEDGKAAWEAVKHLAEGGITDVRS